MDVWMHYVSLGDRTAPKESRLLADFAEVDAQAFDTLGLRLLSGRGVDARDVGRRALGGGRQRDLRGSPSRRQEIRSARPSASRSDGAASRGRSRSRSRARSWASSPTSATRPTSPRRPASSTCRSGSTCASTAARISGCTRGRYCSSARPATPRPLIRPLAAAVADVDTDQTANDVRTMADQIANWQSVTRRPLPDVAVHDVRRAGRAARDGRRLRRNVVGRRAASRRRWASAWRSAREPRRGRPSCCSRSRSGPSCSGVMLGVGGGIGLGKILNSLLWEMTTPGARRARRHRSPHAGGSDVGGLGADATRPHARPEPGSTRRQRPPISVGRRTDVVFTALRPPARRRRTASGRPSAAGPPSDAASVGAMARMSISPRFFPAAMPGPAMMNEASSSGMRRRVAVRTARRRAVAHDRAGERAAGRVAGAQIDDEGRSRRRRPSRQSAPDREWRRCRWPDPPRACAAAARPSSPRPDRRSSSA